MDNTTGADNQKEFLGITQNECAFQGKVVGDPSIHGDTHAFLNLKTSVTELGSNGQWTDTIIIVPFLTMDPKKVAVIQKYVKDGRELLINAFYKPWMQEGVAQHAFMIKKLSLGRKKYIPNEQSGGAPTPSLPVQ